MSYPPAPSSNPYASPAATGAAPVAPVGPWQTRMEYMRAYNYIFENPAWMTTVLSLAVFCVGAMIPGINILLQLLFVGYQFEIIDWLLKSHGRQYPTFEFGRLADYLTRGLWPFLVSLVGTIVLFPVIYVGMIVGVLAVAGIANAGGDTLGPILATLFGLAGLIALFAVVFAASMLLVALILRSGLAQDFAAAFQFDWIKDFISKMWLEMLVSGLFLVATALVLEMIGLLALCVGLFFVLPLLLMAYAHILYQLYAVYLSRGGQPVMPKLFMPQPMKG
jgi:hypothetical protein